MSEVFTLYLLVGIHWDVYCFQHWGYCRHNGPPTWSDNFPMANGSRQSPIDINSEACVLDESLRSVRYEYTKKNKTLANTGHGWKVSAQGEGSVLEAGPLEGRYQLEQFHMHWGSDCNSGSEHTVDGKTFPAEIHIVHWNCDKYLSINDAVDKTDGLAVLGIFFELGDKNETLGQVTDLLHRVPYKHDIIPLEVDIDPGQFIPANTSYWTYPGSLTTPPCFESVTWIVFKDAVSVSEEQLQVCRDLYNFGRLEFVSEEFEGRMVANYRPPLDLGDRLVRHCHLEVAETL